jgi:hypothetical protein
MRFSRANCSYSAPLFIELIQHVHAVAQSKGVVAECGSGGGGGGGGGDDDVTPARPGVMLMMSLMMTDTGGPTDHVSQFLCEQQRCRGMYRN